VKERLDAIERTAVNLVARLAPWCAPIPTAYLVGRATVEHLRWPWLVGAIAAVVVESLGLATTATALELREYNKEKRKSDPVAPWRLAAFLVGLYIIVGIGLTVLLDIVPALSSYAPAVFPLLGLAGMTVLALRADHARRLAGVTADKADRRRQRAARRKATAAAARTVKPDAREQPPAEPDDNGHQPLTYAEFVRLHPDTTDMTGKQVAELAGVHERTGRSWLQRRRLELETPHEE